MDSGGSTGQRAAMVALCVPVLRGGGPSRARAGGPSRASAGGHASRRGPPAAPRAAALHAGGPAHGRFPHRRPRVRLTPSPAAALRAGGPACHLLPQPCALRPAPAASCARDSFTSGRAPHRAPAVRRAPHTGDPARA